MVKKKSKSKSVKNAEILKIMLREISHEQNHTINSIKNYYYSSTINDV